MADVTISVLFFFFFFKCRLKILQIRQGKCPLLERKLLLWQGECLHWVFVHLMILYHYQRIRLSTCDKLML